MRLFIDIYKLCTIFYIDDILLLNYLPITNYLLLKRKCRPHRIQHHKVTSLLSQVIQLSLVTQPSQVTNSNHTMHCQGTQAPSLLLDNPWVIHNHTQ